MVSCQVHIPRMLDDFVSWLNCSRCVFSHTGSSTLVGQASRADLRFRLSKMQTSYLSSPGCVKPGYRICTSSSADFSIVLCGHRPFGSAITILIARHPYYRSRCTTRPEKVRFATRVTQSALPVCVLQVTRSTYTLSNIKAEQPCTSHLPATSRNRTGICTRNPISTTLRPRSMLTQYTAYFLPSISRLRQH